jgi:hypothetical protein
MQHKFRTIGPGDAAPSFGDRVHPASPIEHEAHDNATVRRGRGAPIRHVHSGEIPQWVLDSAKLGRPQDSNDSR